MPKARLIPEQSILESDLIETMLAGHKEYRPDLPYPESCSDMQGCARALMRMYEIKRRPIAVPLRVLCDVCNGSKNIHHSEDLHSYRRCPECSGKGYLEQH